MKLSWRPSERRALLDRYFWLLGRDDDENAWRERCELHRAYRAGLPRVVLSRCPFTGFELMLHYDPYGLDGLWWDANNPARPQAERLYTCHAITGAVAIASPLEPFPFLAKPGPDAPFVYPALLGDSRIYAVLSSLPCGNHRAYCICYFAADECDGVLWPNEWGADFRWSAGGATPGGWHEAPELEDQWDFHLSPYLEKGKLFWIAPDDPTFSLRRGASGFPYLNIPGEHRMQRISRGEIFFADALDERLIEEALG